VIEICLSYRFIIHNPAGGGDTTRVLSRDRWDAMASEHPRQAACAAGRAIAA